MPKFKASHKTALFIVAVGVLSAPVAAQTQQQPQAPAPPTYDAKQQQAQQPPSQTGALQVTGAAPSDDKALPPEKPKLKINHVLIISEDGLRADAVATMHLHWHDLLRHHGSYSDHAMTIRDASTLPAHASMLSGVQPSVHGLTWN
ncbi:MAG TPA: alkaline phosphatase family protein, partial [Polyangia bacterium]|nr:alkaline phosphatase family protein [Polyangia bacterium]